MSTQPTPLVNQLLIALPSLADTDFERTVSLLCQHDAGGAMGVVVNRRSDYTLGEIFSQMGIACEDEMLCATAVLAGGPVHPERGFVIHDGERDWDSSLSVTDGLRVTTSRDVLEAMARGEGPGRALVALGCAGWSAGQLDAELVENSWLTAPSDDEILFSLPLDARWQAAAGRIGVDLAHMPGYAGHG